MDPKSREAIRRMLARGDSTQDAAGQVPHSATFNTQTAAPPPLPPSNPPQSNVAFAPPRRGNQLRVTWTKLKRRVGNGSCPDDSLGDPTTEASDGGSSFQRGAASNRGAKDDADEKDGAQEKEDQVDEVVVEATGSPEFWRTAALPSHTSNKEGGTATGTNGVPNTGLQSEGSSLRQTAYEASGILGVTTNFLRWRLWPMISNFFSPKYHDKSVEEAYQKELWFTSKSAAIFGACFLVFSWVLLVALVPRPWSRFNEINNYLVGPLLNVPLVFLAAFDAPRRKPIIWQTLIFLAILMSSLANLIDMRLCGFYTPTPRCGRKDFMATLYYICSGPVIGLFALGMHRFSLVCISCIWFVVAGASLLDDRPSFIRNMINVLLFHGFILFAHYVREMGDRRMYTMRAELRVQYKARQRAQINERKTLDAKRRFSSYIFHEVRVPLNTALLAVQNLSHTANFDKGSDAADEFAALEGSLQMMSQVLNDVLDHGRLERGGFSSVSRPFSLHQAMRSIFGPLRIDTNARGLALEVSLDPRIDFVARRAAYPEDFEGDKAESVLLQEGDGIVMGDEMRLRQVVSNLAGNACKFTPAGGKITIKTSLVYPIDGYPRYDTTAEELTRADGGDNISTTVRAGDGGGASATYSPRLSEGRLQAHAGGQSPVRDNVLVARIEIQDTGVGIRARDMQENRLFSAYVQTEIGKKQGGKGTGLGLSLVRQIVMLSGGRLGVKSKVGEGSTFWVEWPFAIGAETRVANEQPEPYRRVSSTSDKDLTPSSVASGSDPTEYRFMTTLPHRPSDTALHSIHEGYDSLSGANSSPGTLASSVLSVPPPLTSPPLVSPPPAFLALDAPPPVRPATGPGSIGPIVTATPLGLHMPGVGRTRSREASNLADTTAPEVAAAIEPLLRPPNPATLSTSSAPSALPASAASTPSSTLSRSSALEFPEGPIKVLVVDDDSLTRKLMSRLLARLGCKVATAENGAVALEMILDQSAATTVTASGDQAATETAQSQGIGLDPRCVSERNYDVVFLDNQMPICSGLQVVTRMRALGRDDLIVGITANALLSDQEEYVERGASFVLTKPVLEVDLRKYLIMADRLRAERLDRIRRLSDTTVVDPSPRTSFALPHPGRAH